MCNLEISTNPRWRPAFLTSGPVRFLGNRAILGMKPISLKIYCKQTKLSKNIPDIMDSGLTQPEPDSEQFETGTVISISNLETKMEEALDDIQSEMPEGEN